MSRSTKPRPRIMTVGVGGVATMGQFKCPSPQGRFASGRSQLTFLLPLLFSCTSPDDVPTWPTSPVI